MLSWRYGRWTGLTCVDVRGCCIEDKYWWGYIYMHVNIPSAADCGLACQGVACSILADGHIPQLCQVEAGIFAFPTLILLAVRPTMLLPKDAAFTLTSLL